MCSAILLSQICDPTCYHQTIRVENDFVSENKYIFEEIKRFSKDFFTGFKNLHNSSIFYSYILNYKIIHFLKVTKQQIDEKQGRQPLESKNEKNRN